MRRERPSWPIAVALFFFSCAAGVWALKQTHRWPKGDGPHYSIMAASLVNRGSFDVKPSYLSGDYVGTFFYAPLDYHINWAYFTADSPHWYTYHSFGVPLLVAPFLLIAPVLQLNLLYALQLGMVIWQALAVVIAYLLTEELVRDRVAAVIAALTLLCSVTYLALVGHLFPDIPTATLVGAGLLALAKLRGRPGNLLLLGVIGLLSGFAIYLHVKTGLMALTLLALGIVHCLRHDRRVVAFVALLAPAALLGAVYALLIHSWFHTWFITAPFGTGKLFHFPPGPALVAALLDTSRGILPNNPAFLLVIAGLPAWWQRDRTFLLTVLAVLLPSYVVQSTFEDWAGGFSPAGGRYMLPLIFCLLPAVGYLWTVAGLVGRVAMAGLIAVQAWLGRYNLLQDFEWSYAGDDNPLFALLRQRWGLPPDAGTPIYNHDMVINGDPATAQLIGGLTFVVIAFAIGLTLLKFAPKRTAAA